MADHSTDTPSVESRVRELYEQSESETAKALEELVSRPSFGVLLARGAENFAAVARISSDIGDLLLRNLRVAGRADMTRLARQLYRTEDKLERVLQEIEELRHELTDAAKPAPRSGGPNRRRDTEPTDAAAGTKGKRGASG